MAMFFSRSEETNPYRALLAFLLLTLGVGALGNIAVQPSIPTWYADLLKPSFNPPNWVFAPVWTTLYIFMGVAAWRVWRITGTRSIEMAAFAIQLALNCAWSFIFFSAHQLGAALVEILVMWVAILATLLLFWRRDRLAGLLFVPYLAWVSFATALNHAIWQLNA
jgi:tryptophan-rich sensory protein